MAKKRASKPADPRSAEEVAAQPKTKGLKQPAISKARAAVAKEKTAKKAKGAAIEAAAAPKRKKSTPSPKKDTAVTPVTGTDLRIPTAEPKKQRLEPVVDDPSARAKSKRDSEKARLAQIGNADLLTPQERATMATPVVEQAPRVQEPPLPKDPLRAKVEPLPDSVRNPFATGGAYTFDAPDRALDAPTGRAQSTEIRTKVSKDLERRVKKGAKRGDKTLNLPGTTSIRERALEIAVANHARQVERGEAHPLDVPTDSTPEVTTGHPMRQAVVEAGHNANEEQLRKFASSKGMRFEDAVHGLYRTAQQVFAKDSVVNPRVRKNEDTGKNEIYDGGANQRAKLDNPGVAEPANFDVSLTNFLTADIHRKGGPKPALERPRVRLKAQNTLEELTGPKRSGEFSGKAKGGVIPFGPREIDNSLNRSVKDDPYSGDPNTPGAGKKGKGNKKRTGNTSAVPYEIPGIESGDLARSGAGKYAVEQVKDLPKPPGKKDKAFGGAKDSAGGDIPGTTAMPRVVRSDRGRRATGASLANVRVTDPSLSEASYLAGKEKGIKPRQVAKEQRKNRKSSAKLAMAVRSGDDAAIQSAAFAHRGTQFTQMNMFPDSLDKGVAGPVQSAKQRYKLRPEMEEVISRSSERVTIGDTLPKPETISNPNERAALSAKAAASGGGIGNYSFATSVKPPKTGMVPKRQKSSRVSTSTSAAPASGGYTQPMLEPSLSQAKLAEKFPKDYSKVNEAGEPKKPTVWNMMSRQFLPGKEVPVSAETSALQSEASMVRGKKDTMFTPPKSDKSNIEKI